MRHKGDLRFLNDIYVDIVNHEHAGYGSYDPIALYSNRDDRSPRLAEDRIMSSYEPEPWERLDAELLAKREEIGGL